LFVADGSRHALPIKDSPFHGLLPNKRMQLTDPPWHAPGCNDTAMVPIGFRTLTVFDVSCYRPGPRQSGPQLMHNVKQA
jgi:hypothetical protein